MELTQKRSGTILKVNTHRILGRLRLSDYKTDIFLAANIMDSVFTYIALEQGAQLTEFNSILYAIMNTIGTGTALFLKVVLCIGILWILRKTKREYLLVPLAVVFLGVAISNLIMLRVSGIQL